MEYARQKWQCADRRRGLERTVQRLLEKVQTIISREMKTLESGDSLPSGFPSDAVPFICGLASIGAKKSSNGTHVGIWVRRDQHEFGDKLHSTAKAADADYDKIGSVEGRSSIISERGDLHFKIYNAI
ncbi:MAG: hypothetical protein M2R45_00297 [Verrucomicrobia subdivision 3 bacterium]|nr:hypothetical protein [Limisphaerales bacterium]MCS1412943.1 hypothetical protein [Limisphaerales bacterium]